MDVVVIGTAITVVLGAIIIGHVELKNPDAEFLFPESPAAGEGTRHQDESE